jgi:hypothetical protein
MAALVQYKELKTWGAHRELVRITYDYSVDGGSVGALDIFKAKEKCVVKLAEMYVKTACTSGGSATVSVGKTGDLAGMVAATAVASLTADAVILGAALDASHVLAADDIVKMDIAVAALTAGKIEMVFEVIKF